MNYTNRQLLESYMLTSYSYCKDLAILEMDSYMVDKNKLENNYVTIDDINDGNIYENKNLFIKNTIKNKNNLIIRDCNIIGLPNPLFKFTKTDLKCEISSCILFRI